MIVDEARVVFRKYDDRPHRRTVMTRLGNDEYGTWLGAPAGTVIHIGDNTASFTAKHASVRLLPTGQWWTALFAAAPDEWDVYCDITTPPRWTHPGEVTMIDLDLDLRRIRTDQRVELLDEDQFVAHQVSYNYPAHVIDQATATARELRSHLNHAEPFASHYRTWLDLAGTLTNP